jgi:hypothetical protein
MTALINFEQNFFQNIGDIDICAAATYIGYMESPITEALKVGYRRVDTLEDERMISSLFAGYLRAEYSLALALGLMTAIALGVAVFCTLNPALIGYSMFFFERGGSLFAAFIFLTSLFRLHTEKRMKG